MNVDQLWRALDNIIEGNPVALPTKEGGDKSKPSDLSMIVSGLLGKKEIKPAGGAEPKKADAAAPTPKLDTGQDSGVSVSEIAAMPTESAAGAKGGGLFKTLAKVLGGIF